MPSFNRYHIDITYSGQEPFFSATHEMYPPEWCGSPTQYTRQMNSIARLVKVIDQKKMNRKESGFDIYIIGQWSCFATRPPPPDYRMVMNAPCWEFLKSLWNHSKYPTYNWGLLPSLFYIADPTIMWQKATPKELFPGLVSWEIKWFWRLEHSMFACFSEALLRSAVPKALPHWIASFYQRLYHSQAHLQKLSSNLNTPTPPQISLLSFFYFIFIFHHPFMFLLVNFVLH